MNEHNPSLIAAYVDDEISPPDRKLFLAHLDICEICRQHLDSHLELRQRLASMPPPPVSTDFEGFWRRLEPQLRSRQVIPGAAWLWGGLMFLLFVTIQAVLIAFGLLEVLRLLGVPLVSGPLPIVTFTQPDWVSNVLSFIERNTLLGYLVEIPIWNIVPLTLIALLLLGFSLSFVTWTLTSLRRSPVPYA